MQRHFEIELGELRKRVLTMGELVQRALYLSLGFLKGWNISECAEAANEVIERIEPQVNELHRDIDQSAFDLIALRQVLAADLRFVTAATRIASDLERMSDRSVNIARRAASVLTFENRKSVIQIPRMADAVEMMVRDSLAAFERREEALARSVLNRDMEVDGYRDEVFQELVDDAAADSRFVQQALDLILVARNLERIADHATNIAESVVFMVLGEDIRHRYHNAGGM